MKNCMVWISVRLRAGNRLRLKFLASLLLAAYALSAPCVVHAGNIMVLSQASAGAGGSCTIQVAIENDDPFVSFQIDIPLPAQLTYVSNSATLNPLRSQGHQLWAGMISGNVLRIFSFSFVNAAFTGNSGVVVSFTLSAGTLPGTYNLIPSNAIIGNAASQNIITGLVNGSVTILSPDISTSASALQFGATPLGQYTDRTLTIYNNGNQALQVTGIQFNSNYFSVVGEESFSIPPGSSHVLTVRFSSVVKGNYQKIMVIQSNDPDQPAVNIQLNAIAFAVNELHCGSMVSFSGHPDTLKLSINNMEPFVSFQFDLILPSPLSYINNSAYLSDRKADHVVMSGMINANTLRVFAFSVNNSAFSGFDGEILSLAFDVFGTGGSYPLTLTNVIIADTTITNIMSAFYHGNLQVAAPDIHANSSINFGHVSVTDTASIDLVVYNYGQDTLKINGFEFMHPSFFSSQTQPFYIMPYGSAAFTIGYYNPVKGNTAGIMKIISNDPDENPFPVNLSAYSFAPNYLIVKDRTSMVQDTVLLQIWVNNHEDFIAFDFRLHFPAEMNFLQEDCHLTNRAQDHILYAGIIQPNVLRVFAFSMQQQTFLGHTGAVVEIGFAVNAASVGQVLPVTLSNAILGDINNQNIIYGSQDGTITIVEQTIPDFLNVGLNQPEVIFAAEQKCYNALQTINIYDLEVMPGGTAAFIAGYNVKFLHGTIVQSGAYLHATITTDNQFCEQKSALVASTFGENSDASVPLQSTNELMSYLVFPNPTTGLFTLQISGMDETPKACIELLGIHGERISEGNSMTNNHYKFDITTYQSGIYILRIVKGNSVEVMKILKL